MILYKPPPFKLMRHNSHPLRIHSRAQSELEHGEQDILVRIRSVGFSDHSCRVYLWSETEVVVVFGEVLAVCISGHGSYKSSILVMGRRNRHRRHSLDWRNLQDTTPPPQDPCVLSS